MKHKSKSEGDKSFRGFKVQKINSILMIFGCTLAILVFTSTFKIKNKYESIISAMNDYAECTKALNQFQEATDYLTNQVRLFSVNKDIAYLNAYFDEVNNSQRRELSLEILEMSHQRDMVDIYMTLALSESNFLIETDLYSMKLICDAVNIPQTQLPEQINNIQISEKDKTLSSAEKIAVAQEILFDKEYLSSKDKIINLISTANSNLINQYISEQNTNTVKMEKHFTSQYIYTTVLFIVYIGLYVILVFLVLIPLFNNLSSIQKGIKMKLKGGYEIRYIAKAYNSLCEKNENAASILKHKAEHDPLTGLINRNAFSQIKTALQNSQEPLAYLIIDIDFFKSINDQYGHLVGDEVLKKISSLLMEQFRNSDYVARVGGDEFAVIMTKFGTSAVDIIQRKIDSLNHQLQNLSEDLPKVSLSVGVAFSENGYFDELVAKADKALYKVKKGGRCNCSFYDDNL